MAGLPEPNRAYALFIGVGEFDDPTYKPLPSSHGSVEELARLMRARDGVMWRLPEDRIKVLGPRVTADEARIALNEATEMENLQALLVCVSCHGHHYYDRPRPSELHLAMTSSQHDIDGTHWRFDEISRALKRAKDTRKIKHILLIIDACEADGLSVPDGQGSGDTAEIDHLAVPGVVVLTATQYRTQAWPQWPGTEWTAFLGALIQSIEDGVPGPQETLTAKRVFVEAARRIAVARVKNPKIPEPYNWGWGISEIPLCRNKAYLPAVTAVGNPAGGKGAAPPFIDAGECFSAIHAAYRGGRSRSIVGIVGSFCGNLNLAVDEIARLVKRLGTSEFSSYLDDAYGAACAERSPAEIANFADCLHSNDVPIDKRLVVALHGRENAGRIATDVCRLMLSSRCHDCVEAAEVVSAEIVGDAELSAEALAVWG
jgi:hypothetical protein